MENTDAASVELRTAPIRKANLGSILRTFQQNSPVMPAVRNTPNVARMPACTAIGLASFQRVPNPP